MEKMESKFYYPPEAREAAKQSDAPSGVDNGTVTHEMAVEDDGLKIPVLTIPFELLSLFYR